MSATEDLRLSDAYDILKTASNLLESGELCDAVLKTEDGGVFQIHRVILASCSPYFRALFAYGGDHQEFTVPGVTSSALSMLVKVAYSGRTEVDEESVKQLLPAADQLCFGEAVRVCSDFLLDRMDCANCIGFRNFAKMYSFVDIEKEAEKCLLSKFWNVVETSEEFLEMSLEELVDVLGSDRLNVRAEEQVWEAGLKWIDHRPEERKAHLAEIMRCVRLGLLDTSFFRDRVQLHPYVVKNESCFPIMIETLEFFRDLESIAKITEAVETPFLATPRIPHAILFAIGGWREGSATDRIETYDTKADRWIQVSEVDPAGPRAYHKLGVIGFDIYTVGGFNDNGYFRSCRCFNASTKEWRDVAPMHSNRCYVSVATLDGFIYAMGGFDGKHRHNSAERYDHRTNQWTLIAPMNAQRSDAGATTLNKLVYIVGGYNGTKRLSSGEFYDPNTGQWAKMPRMRQRRSSVSVISHNGHIYAIGGFDGISRLSSGEKYDPVTDQWSSIPEMLHPRRNFAIEVMNEIIIVMGGYDGETILPVECFDGNKWYEVTDMNVPSCALAACVIPGLPDVSSYVHPNRRGLMEEKRQEVLQQQRRLTDEEPDEEV